jgi:hypothetical protein
MIDRPDQAERSVNLLRFLGWERKQEGRPGSGGPGGLADVVPTDQGSVPSLRWSLCTQERIRPQWHQRVYAYCYQQNNLLPCGSG